jgi:hypothetical protein
MVVKRGGTGNAIKDTEVISLICRELVSGGCAREADFFMIGCHCNIPVREILSLKKDDIEVSQSGVGFIKPVGSNNFMISPTGMAVVEKLASRNPEDVYLFQSVSRHPVKKIGAVKMEWVSKQVKKVVDTLDLNIPVTLISMIKTFGYHELVGGERSAKEVQLLLRRPNQRDFLKFINTNLDELHVFYKSQ